MQTVRRKGQTLRQKVFLGKPATTSGRSYETRISLRVNGKGRYTARVYKFERRALRFSESLHCSKGGMGNEHQHPTGRSRRGTELVWDGTPNAHLYASGQSGRGKSFFLKHCIAQLPQQGVRCIVFDYSGDFQQNASGWPHSASGRPVNAWMCGTKVAIDPFRRLSVSGSHTECSYDTAGRIAEAVTTAYQIRGTLQQTSLRNALKEYLDSGNTQSGFSGLLDRVRQDRGLSRAMAHL